MLFGVSSAEDAAEQSAGDVCSVGCDIELRGVGVAEGSSVSRSTADGAAREELCDVLRLLADFGGDFDLEVGWSESWDELRVACSLALSDSATVATSCCRPVR